MGYKEANSATSNHTRAVSGSHSNSLLKLNGKILFKSQLWAERFGTLHKYTTLYLMSKHRDKKNSTARHQLVSVQ